MYENENIRDSRIVRDLRTLKGMEKQGLIILHPHTGKKVYWNGQYVKAYYIDDGVEGICRFTYKNNEYEINYDDGSFYPYVYQTTFN